MILPCQSFHIPSFPAHFAFKKIISCAAFLIFDYYMRTLKIKKMLAKIVHNYDVKNSNIGKVYVKPIQRYQNHFYETIV